MFRKLTESFTATHFTILACVAVLAPSALVAIPSFSNVAVIDPNSGYRANVDTKGRVFTFDTLASYAIDPKNFVSIFHNINPEDECKALYKVPNGRSLVLRHVDAYIRKIDQSSVGSSYFLNTVANCSADNLIAAASVDRNYDTIALGFDSGTVLRSGTVLYGEGGTTYNNNGFSSITGYLVPAVASPTASGGDATQVRIGSDSMADKRRVRR